MTLEHRYAVGKAKLLADKSICAPNRQLFRKFLDRQEYKLKRRRGLPKLDEHSYRTLDGYVTRLRTVNRWFKNKAWKQLTRRDIQRVYDDLEDGKILSRFGERVKDRATFYTRILRGEPFAMAGKRELARQVMEFHQTRRSEEVRFIPETAFRQLVEAASRPEHRLLLWLCWDVGENIFSLLALRKSDCARQMNRDTNDAEYLVNLRRETLKRSRRARSELTNYPETVQLLDAVLRDKRDSDQIFEFGHRQAAKVLLRLVKQTGVRCSPGGQIVTLKDLRSSMACDLLNKGWTTDEVNARLGHTPSSRELDRYVNFLAIDRRRPKQKVQEFQVKRLLDELDKFRQREKLLMQRQDKLTLDNQEALAQLAQTKAEFIAFKKDIVAELRAFLRVRTKQKNADATKPSRV